MTARTARFEFRVDPESKAEIEQAAAISGESTSDFVYHAAIERARAVLRQNRATIVPSEYFDQLMDALDAPGAPNERTREAARQLLSGVVTRR